MKKFKAIFLSLAAMLTVAAATTAVACNKSDTTPDVFSGEEESTVTLRFSSAQIDVCQYENAQLEYTAKGSTATVQFSSSDETIATVDANGKVYAKDLGTVLITATLEDVSATCSVTVVASPYAPQITASASEYSVEQNETFEFEVNTLWGNEPFAEEVVYSVAFAEGYLDATAEIATNGNMVSFNSADVGSVDLIVSATVRGIYTSKKITINVCKSKLKLQSTSETLMPSLEGYSASIYATDLIEGYDNRLPLDFDVAKGNETLTADITWTIVEGEGVATVQDGVLIANRTGKVVVEGSATVDGETVTVLVSCESLAPVLHFEQKAVLEVANLQTLTITDDFVGTIESVTLNGLEISKKISKNKVAFSPNNFPKQASKLGAQQIEVKTNLATYLMDVDIYTLIINDADELDQMATIANTGDMEYSTRQGIEVNSEIYDGYFVLGNDIDYNRTFTSMTDTGKVFVIQSRWQDNTRGFRGIFDGCGYNIDGLTAGKSSSAKESGGIFGYLGTNGVVRNVSFTNAVLLVNNGFICAMGEGSVENVSISYKKIGGDGETSNINTNDPRRMGSFFSFHSGTLSSVKNCLIDVSAAEITLEKGIYSGGTSYNLDVVGKAATLDNVVLITPDKQIAELSSETKWKASYEDCVNDDTTFKTFTEPVWTRVNGIPMFTKQAESLDVNRSVSFINVEDSLIAGYEMVVQLDNPYAKVAISEIPGVALTNGVLSATDEAFGQTVVITATSLLNPDITATHEVYIDSYGINVAAPVTEEMPVVYTQDPILKIGDNSWIAEENYVYIGKDVVGQGASEIKLDVSMLAWGTQELTIVSVKDGVRQHFVIDVEVTYKKGDFEDTIVAANSFFDSYRGTLVVDNADLGVITAPEGYDGITRVDSSTGWTSSVFSNGLYNRANFGGYSDLFFAVKIVNGYFRFQAEKLETSSWAHFHLIQTSKDMWAVEATLDGKVYTQLSRDGAYSLSNSSAPLNSLGALLYHNGWANGYLIYHSTDANVTTSVYATEVRGIAIPAEGTVVMESALDAGTKLESEIPPGGWDSVYEISKLSMGSFSKTDLASLGYDKYSFMCYFGGNFTIPGLKATMDTTLYQNVVVAIKESYFLVEVTKTETGWSVFMNILPSYHKVGGGYVQPDPLGYTFESTGKSLSEIFYDWYGWDGAVVRATEVRGINLD